MPGRSHSQVHPTAGHLLSEEAGWIPQNISKRECLKFVVKTDKDPEDPICHCGYNRSMHNSDALGNHDTPDWKVSVNTKTIPTDAFGEIEFMGFSQKMAKFVRVDHETDMEAMLTLLMDQWDLEQPNLLISVTGGAKNFSMKPRLKQVFRSGLMKAAQSTGAWIITGGMHAGVMKHVGEAVRDYSVGASTRNKVIALAICPWGCVQNRQALIDGEGKWPAEYRYDRAVVKKESPIDMNHSHFIMVDNGTIHQFGTEIAFRARLENAVSRMRSVTSEELANQDDVKVPLVSVVLEGGPGTLETVKRAIEVGTPAVIVEGSGRAADILAYAYSASKEEEIEVTDQFGCKQKRVITIIDNQLQAEITKMIMEEFGDRDITRQVGWVRDCLQKRNLITVFQLEGKNSPKDIDIAILQALLKANKDHDVDQLKLALAWNRIDVAKTDIFTEDKKWERGVLNEVMYRALLQNRVHFIKLFIENGVSLRDFLTIKRLLQLYNNIPKNSLLYQLLKRESKHKTFDIFTLRDVGNVIHGLMGDFFSPMYLRDPRYANMTLEDVINLLREGSRVSSTTSLHSTMAHMNFSDGLKAAAGIAHGTQIIRIGDVEVLLPDFDEPTRELFIWAVLLNRHELAMLFWAEGRDGIAAALTGQKITSSMLKKTEDSELQKSLKWSEKKFDDLSCGVVGECYSQDEQLAQLMLVRELPNYGNSTIIQLAVQADNKTFVAHPACQNLLHNIWRGKMTNENGMIRIALCVLFPPLVWLLIKFRADDRARLTDERYREEYAKQEKRQKRKQKHDSDQVELLSITKDGHRHEFSESSKRRRSGVPFCSKIIHFFNAPLITFIYNCVSYMVFLGVYAFILLTAFNPPISIAEIILIVWVFTLFAEEIRQLLTDNSSNFRMKLKSYITDPWNIMDVITIVLFITGMILRGIPNEVCFDVARIVLAVDLMCFFFRILHIFSVHRELGPKLVMIGRMMIDLFYFIIILLVFIVAYGLALQAILYPNSTLEPALFQDVIRKAYWQMYGELFLEELEGQSECTFDPLLYSNNTLPRCPANTWVGPILLGVYIMLTNVLMLNLLIAMFSYTFNQVQPHTDEVWKFQLYGLVREYDSKPPLAPPFIALAHIVLLFRACFRACGLCVKEDNPFKMQFTDAEVKQIIGWENINADEYLRKSQRMEKHSTQNRVIEMHKTIESLSVRVEEVADQSLMLQTGTATNNNQGKLPPQLDYRLSYLEEQMQRTAKALDFIVQSLVEKNMAAKTGAPNLPDVDKKREEEQQKRDEQTRQQKEMVQMILTKQLELHIKARSSPYPKTNIMRFSVPDEKVPWDIEFAEYEPVNYTSNMIKSQPWYADIDLASVINKNSKDEASPLKFNAYDEECKVNRVSYCGEYQIKDGYPLNPRGRTGMSGRGLLGHWGPNHAGDPIVTRWKRKGGEVVKDQGKKVLEFVAILRTDNKQWAIPGGLLETGKEIHSCLKAEFKEEALGTLMEDEGRQQIQSKLDTLFSEGKQVYQGYMDDPRNTDNAWMETTAMNYHDEEGTILDNFILRAGESADVVRWQTVSSRQSLYGGHLNLLQTVAKELNAAF